MIVTCGEALIDMIPEPTQAGGEGFVPHSGGAVFNSSIALGRLDADVALLTGLSTDLFGRQLKRDLGNSNVVTSLLCYSDRPTTLAFVRLKDGQASYTFYDENSAGRMISNADVPELPDTTKALFFGGISLAVEPSGSTYTDLAIRVAEDHVVMVDPNIRPGFISNEQSYRYRLARLFAVADVVKVSDEDLDWILPGDHSLDNKLTQLRSLGPPVVIMTRGKDGATAIANGEAVSVPARPVQVADTVGAGDAFSAGVLAKLSELDLLSKESVQNINSDSLQAVLDYGIQAAAITVSRAGANPPWKHELNNSS